MGLGNSIFGFLLVLLPGCADDDHGRAICKNRETNAGRFGCSFECCRAVFQCLEDEAVGSL